jgi:hypothetical protein
MVRARVLVALVLGFGSQLAFAGQVTGPVIDPALDQVVPASCTVTDSDNGWCDCTVRGLDDTTYGAEITCNATLCYHMTNWQDIQGCLNPPQAYTCNLSRGDVTCAQRVGVDGVKVQTAQDACDYVLSRLNGWNTSAPVFYCNDTYLRGGWKIDSITQNAR